MDRMVHGWPRDIASRLARQKSASAGRCGRLGAPVAFEARAPLGAGVQGPPGEAREGDP
jgi:hypothetical protein